MTVHKNEHSKFLLKETSFMFMSSFDDSTKLLLIFFLMFFEMHALISECTW